MSRTIRKPATHLLSSRLLGLLLQVNFEDLQFEKIRNANRLNQYVIDHIKDDGKYLIFLDEIQHVRNFEKVLSSLRVTVNCSIFITGSNSKLLSGKVATLLKGYYFNVVTQIAKNSKIVAYKWSRKEQGKNRFFSFAQKCGKEIP